MEVEHRAFFIEKAISLPLVGTLVFILPSEQILTLFIVLGQAHFLISYLYQVRGGKITKNYILLYLATAFSLLTLLLYFGRLDLIIIFAGVHFLIHFLCDEFFLAKKQITEYRLLEALPILFLYSGFIVDTIELTHTLPYFALGAGAIMGIYVGCILLGKWRGDYISLYMWLTSCVLLALFLLDIAIPLEILLGTLVLLHYSEWYIQYFLKTKKDSQKLRTYLGRALAINTTVMSLYLLYAQTDYFDPVLIYAFLPPYFYIWTLLHTLFSTRRSDFDLVLKNMSSTILR